MHWLYIMLFDRLLAALVLIKYEAMICGILLSNHQKSCCCIKTSACRLLLVSQSINTYMSCEYRCQSKENKVICTKSAQKFH